MPTANYPISAFGLEGKVAVAGLPSSKNAFIPKANPAYQFRKEFVRDMNAFLAAPGGDALWITGPTGSGKTSGVLEYAARVNWPVISLTATARTEAADLIGTFVLRSDNPGETPSMRFQHGPLAIAMKEGYILLINEVDLVDPGELSGLNDVLEGRPLVIPQNGGETVHPSPNFRVIVTGNSAGKGDHSALYAGVVTQNLAAMDRYRMILVGYPDASTEEAILESVAPKLPKQIREKMVQFAGDVRGAFENGDSTITMSTRTLARWAKLTLVFRRADNALGYALDQALGHRAMEEEREALLQIAHAVFGDLWGGNAND